MNSFKITPSYVEYVPIWDSNHEEANSRIILHVAFASSLGVQQAVVFSPDTDLFVRLINHFSELNMKSVYFNW
jgi:hypothetical protein